MADDLAADEKRRSSPRPLRVMGDSRPLSARPWLWFLTCTLALSAACLLFPPGRWMGAIQTAFSLTELAAVCAALWFYRPARPASWRLLAVGVGLYASASAVWYGWYPFVMQQSAPLVSAADVLYGGAYLCFIAGLTVLVRRRSGRDEGMGPLIDAAIVSTSVGVFAWVYLLQPLGVAAQGSATARGVSLSYPVLDLALAALLARAVFTRGTHPPAFWLLCGFVTSLLATDFAYTLALIHGTWEPDRPLAMGWLVAEGCLAAAALHPSMRSIEDSGHPVTAPEMSWRRLAFLAVAAAVVPAGQLIGPRDQTAEVLVGSTLIFGLCLARMGVLSRDLSRAARALRRNDRDLRSTVELLRVSEDDLRHLAQHDVLTGLPNRVLFDERMQAARARPGLPTAVMLVDLDGFKGVNDDLGHAAGDALLVIVARRLEAVLRPGDTAARLGGDEFGVLAHGMDRQAAARLAERLLHGLDDPVEIEGRSVTARASVGIAHLFAEPGERDLLRDADTAMYTAKRKGGNRFEVFNADRHCGGLDSVGHLGGEDVSGELETTVRDADTPKGSVKQAGGDAIGLLTAGVNTEALTRLELEVALRRAVKMGEFALHYQPQLCLETGRVAGLEALLRWERPGHGIVPPSAFVPILEESGLIVEVGSWVISAVCEQMSRWGRSEVGPVPVSVNVACRQLMEGDLEGDVRRALDGHGVPAHLLELELTETTLMANTERTIATLMRLRDRGLGISIDDFGTGYSSLAYLRRFPIDKLKIDMSFIREITSNADDAAIALAIIRMAHSLKLEVVAEGVETAAQLSYLRRHRCDQVQGYYFSRPLAVPAIEQLLLGGACLPTAEGEATPSRATLLAVDDDPNVLDALQMLLGDDGYRILTAASAAEGFEALALHDVQVLLCDERMPGMSGNEFLARVKEMHPDTLRIVLSGSADDAALIGSINRGEVYRYYAKPWDAAELRNNLRQAFRHYWELHDTRTGRRSNEDHRDHHLVALPA